ncbi:hypothetical protein V6N12_031446 [Hibiscus sabdariffa]|uniref:Uncharacterized protein n=1 Tax=Hibiscus sabdariffa TaxID=183260 RepID=A0ABR1ZGQ1_9ROSI
MTSFIHAYDSLDITVSKWYETPRRHAELIKSIFSIGSSTEFISISFTITFRSSTFLEYHSNSSVQEAKTRSKASVASRNHWTRNSCHEDIRMDSSRLAAVLVTLLLKHHAPDEAARARKQRQIDNSTESKDKPGRINQLAEEKRE